MTKPLILEVNVHYRDMESLIKVNVESELDMDEYLDMIRQHIRISKVVIDRRIERQSSGDKHE